MVVLAVAALFAVATFIGLGVVISSLTQAWQAYGDLKIALLACDNCTRTSVQWHGTAEISALPRPRKSSINRAKRVRPLSPRVLHAAA